MTELLVYNCLSVCLCLIETEHPEGRNSDILTFVTLALSMYNKVSITAWKEGRKEGWMDGWIIGSSLWGLLADCLN